MNRYAEWVATRCQIPGDLETDMTLAFGFSYKELNDEDHVLVIKECLGGDKAMKEVLRPTFDAHALVDPVPPWTFERTCLLPSTPELHRTFRTVSMGSQHVPADAQKAIYFKVYDQLQYEYAFLSEPFHYLWWTLPQAHTHTRSPTHTSAHTHTLPNLTHCGILRKWNRFDVNRYSQRLTTGSRFQDLLTTPRKLVSI